MDALHIAWRKSAETMIGASQLHPPITGWVPDSGIYWPPDGKWPEEVPEPVGSSSLYPPDHIEARAKAGYEAEFHCDAGRIPMCCSALWQWLHARIKRLDAVQDEVDAEVKRIEYDSNPLLQHDQVGLSVAQQMTLTRIFAGIRIPRDDQPDEFHQQPEWTFTPSVAQDQVDAQVKLIGDRQHFMPEHKRIDPDVQPRGWNFAAGAWDELPGPARMYQRHAYEWEFVPMDPASLKCAQARARELLSQPADAPPPADLDDIRGIERAVEMTIHRNDNMVRADAMVDDDDDPDQFFEYDIEYDVGPFMAAQHAMKEQQAFPSADDEKSMNSLLGPPWGP